LDNLHRSALLQSLSNTISDYRLGEIAPITPAHVERWLNQFDTDDQPVILAEMDSLMKRFYFSKVRVKQYLRSFIRNDIIAARDPRKLLPHVHFLHIQQTGNSQSVLLDIVDEILREDYQYSIAICSTANIYAYMYIDDCIYTGNRLRYDMTGEEGSVAWIPKEAPPGCRLLVYTITVHVDGLNYVKQHLHSAAEKKNIALTGKYSLKIDNTHSLNSKAEFLWPEKLTADPLIDAYTTNLRAILAQRNLSNYDLFRYSGVPSQESFFSSSEARRVVEKAFLKKGIQIVTASQNPAESIRPLGFAKKVSLGFGTVFVTYRNIANNCPLVLWWGDPSMPRTHPLGKWYPLFPRRTNL